MPYRSQRLEAGPIRERFERGFTPEPNSGCWLWMGANRCGYGAIWINGRHEVASRTSWALYKGTPIPVGVFVLHKCDTPACVNPDHLFLGTQADNMRDMAAKGRSLGINSGEAHGMSKLSSADILAIRSDTRTQRRIAVDYGVNPSTISRIQAGKRWRVITAHLNRQPPEDLGLPSDSSAP